MDSPLAPDGGNLAANEPDWGELLFATTSAEPDAVPPTAPASATEPVRSRWTTAGVVAACAVLAMALGLIIDWPGVRGHGQSTAAPARPARPARPIQPALRPALAPLIIEPMVRPEFPQTPRPQPAPPAPSPTITAAQINRAVDRGVRYLRQHGGNLELPCRYEGLLGLTLLECGVSPYDELVQRIADSLRTRADRLAPTYLLATTIFFFDRLGANEDRERIRMMGERLIGGQLAEGTWSYTCRPTVLPMPAIQGPLIYNPKTGNYTTAAAERLAKLQARRALQAARMRGDHSNTQFATLALWIAQRYGVDARPALRRVEEHFRETQTSDGWSYTPWSGSRIANTCAGLLGLAVGHGIDRGIGRDARLRKPPLADPAVAAALSYLGERLSAIPDHANGRLGDAFVPYSAVEGHDTLYTFWSLERTAALYNRTHIGRRPWYPWVVRWLVAAQQANGSWQHALGPEIDTCFALLVLRRSNLAADLSRVLRDPRPPHAPALPKVITPMPAGR